MPIVGWHVHIIGVHTISQAKSFQLHSRSIKSEYTDMPAKQTSTGKRRTSKRLSKSLQMMSMYIAMVIRNVMEDFHVQHLSDKQMKELNPIIRNAVCTALYAFENYDRSIAAKQFVDFNFSLIPEYWEPPRLTDDFLKLEKWLKQNAEGRRTKSSKGKEGRTS